MHFTTVITAVASLTGMVSAQVAIGHWSGTTCTGSLLYCPDVPPYTCCYPPSGFSSSMQVLNKPPAANFAGFYEDTSTANPCGFFIGSTTADGSQNFCVDVPTPGTFFGGGAYDDFAGAGASIASQSCTSSVAASELHLADGRKINVENMSAEEVDAIRRLSSGPSSGKSAAVYSLEQ